MRWVTDRSVRAMALRPYVPAQPSFRPSLHESKGPSLQVVDSDADISEPYEFPAKLSRRLESDECCCTDTLHPSQSHREGLAEQMPADDLSREKNREVIRAAVVDGDDHPSTWAKHAANLRERCPVVRCVVEDAKRIHGVEGFIRIWQPLYISESKTSPEPRQLEASPREGEVTRDEIDSRDPRSGHCEPSEIRPKPASDLEQVLSVEALETRDTRKPRCVSLIAIQVDEAEEFCGPFLGCAPGIGSAGARVPMCHGRCFRVEQVEEFITRRPPRSRG